MQKFVTIQELINELEKAPQEIKNQQLVSIGTGSGSNGNYVFYTEDNNEVKVKIFR